MMTCSCSCSTWVDNGNE